MAEVNYSQILRDAWQAHLQPKNNAPTFISLFAGGGGSSLGYSMAGYRELLAVDWDKGAEVTFKLNFPDIPFYYGDICSLTVEMCFQLTNIEIGELDLLDGSPPCQGFSLVGKRQINDPRNDLYKEYVRILRGFMPKVFVMENVPGLVRGKMKLVFADIMRELKKSGYKVKCSLLNAMYFNVPQSRERLIWIGVREDLGIEPSYPLPQNKPIPCGIAMQGADKENVPELNDKYGRLWPFIRPGKAVDSLIDIDKGYTGCRKLNPNLPAPTLPRLQQGHGWATLVHWEEQRAISIGEAKRLGSFPDEFRLTGDYSTQWAIIGNSVPPLFMRAIAEHIKEHILSKCKTL